MDSQRAYSGHVEHPKLFRISDLVKAARTRAGISQKAFAADLGMDQSVLCAVERGRRRIHGLDQLHAIAKAAAVTPGQLDELRWAWAHDRVIYELQTVGLSPAAQRIVSVALLAERTLDHEEMRGLERTINLAVGSKQMLTELTKKRDLQDEEARMT